MSQYQSDLGGCHTAYHVNPNLNLWINKITFAQAFHVVSNVPGDLVLTPGGTILLSTTSGGALPPGTTRGNPPGTAIPNLRDSLTQATLKLC